MKKIAFSVLATSALATIIAASDAEASSYTVKSGDSLWKIAAANGTSVTQLKELNSLSTDFIFPNKPLQVKSSTVSTLKPSTQVSPVQTVSSNTDSTYTVQSGDTLGKIAVQFKTTVTSIQTLNQLSNHLIFPGQVLKISGTAAVPTATPPKESTNTPKPTSSEPTSVVTATYTVKSGDTLGKIAIQFKTSVSAIQQLNSLSSHMIYIGQKLKVSSDAKVTPSEPKPSQPVSPPTPSVPTNPGNTIYTIVSGDTLSGIAYRHRTTVDQLMKWNNLTSTSIRIGQKLNIGSSGEVAPVSAPSPVPVATPPTVGGSLYDQVIQLAKPLLGIPYVWGGSSTAGFDCSGFIYYVYKQAGLDIARTNTLGYDARSYDVSNPIPGDLVFFSNTYRPGISHMGIYIGNNQFIHAGGNRVQITNLNDSYWKTKFDGYKRFYAVD